MSRVWMFAMVIVGLILIGLGVGQCSHAQAETGKASWYGSESGSHRADGHRFNPQHVSCAHKTLKLGTWIRVTDLKTGRSIRCQVLDRGPYLGGRIVDLSSAAADRLGIKPRGVVRVRITKIR